ncbi:MAG: TVP38/TMEM64 family protein [Sulfobacillus acidophilus]|uniref:TVP38/TMEM64 family membrane protein n=1 Tax=Sulfobacillus acidophilus TaxID=53633 RepID=A0A2T2WPA6_9FIRM|nr:MAG: TVP38/TMEM64 family protein [Sulfobacillus acidophilus]
MKSELVKRGFRWIQAHRWIWAVVAAIALVGAIWWAWDVVASTVGIRQAFHVVSLALRNFAGALGPWGPFLLIIALAVHSILIVFPMEIPTLVAFALYGPFGGVAVVWTGSMLTAAISFMLGRLLGPPVLQRWTSNARVRALVRVVGQLNPFALILLRWVSFIPFDVLNMAFGACQVPVVRFAWTTAIGELVTSFVMALLYRTALHAHWGELVGLVAVLFAVGWGIYWWSGKTHLKRLTAPDDMEA